MQISWRFEDDESRNAASIDVDLAFVRFQYSGRNRPYVFSFSRHTFNTIVEPQRLATRRSVDHRISVTVLVRACIQVNAENAIVGVPLPIEG